MTSQSEYMTRQGGCLCGGVRFAIAGELRPVVYCHCEQCRRTSGHFVAATAAPKDRVSLLKRETLQWYDSSQAARRGFCQQCGSSLLWEAHDEDYIAIMAGALDQPTGLSQKRHIFVANAGDYYSLTDELPKSQQDHTDW